MKRATAGAIIACLTYSFQAAAMDARCIGTFPIVQSPAEAAPQVLRAAAKAAQAGCTRTIEVSALVNNSFSPASLTPYGWRLVARIGEVVTLEGCAASVDALGSLPGICYVKLPSRVFPLMDSARKVTHTNELHDATARGGIGRRLTGKGVLFGILDMEFDTHHPAFLDSNGGTRFVALWDQTDTTKGNRNRFGYGVVKNHAQLLIDSLFGLGLEFHGTFMTSYAAGSEWKCPYYGAAPDAKIAAVKIGPTDQNIIDGLIWLDSLADSLHMPCVVNMSLGNADGPHDGTSLTDRAIDNFSSKPGHIVVGAAGNDGAKMGHIAFPIGKTEVRGAWVAPVQVATPTGRVGFFSGIDMWADSGNYFTATVFILDTSTTPKTYRQGIPRLSTATPPRPGITPVLWTNSTTGKRDTLIVEDSVERACPLNGRTHCKVYLQAYNPSLFLGVTVVDSASAGGNVHAWNVYKASFTSFQMQGFYNGDTVMSVNEIGGTAKRNITVGATQCKTVFMLWNGQAVAWNGTPNPQSDSGAHRLAGTSGRGPTLDGRIKPDITAPGHEVVGAMPRNMKNNGRIAWPADTHSTGRYTNTGGTSVAAPIVAGIVALMLEANPQLTVEDARRYIQETAITDAITGTITTPNNAWGAGRVNAAGAIAKMLNLPLGSHSGAVPGQRPVYGLIGLAENRLQLVGWQKDASDRPTVEFFSINGRRVLRQQISSVDLTASYASLPQGIYLARAIRKGNILCSTIITRLNQK
jgi:minor extracellular serine protease Vpr